MKRESAWPALIRLLWGFQTDNFMSDKNAEHCIQPHSLLMVRRFAALGAIVSFFVMCGLFVGQQSKDEADCERAVRETGEPGWIFAYCNPANGRSRFLGAALSGVAVMLALIGVRMGHSSLWASGTASLALGVFVLPYIPNMVGASGSSVNFYDLGPIGLVPLMTAGAAWCHPTSIRKPWKTILLVLSVLMGLWAGGLTLLGVFLFLVWGGARGAMQALGALALFLIPQGLAYWGLRQAVRSADHHDPVEKGSA